MLSSYLKIAARNLLKLKVYSIINIAGLAIGMALCMLIYQYVKTELTFDSFHDNRDNIYRMVPVMQQDSGEWKNFAMSPMPLGPTLVEEFPEVERFVRFTNLSEAVIKAGGRCFTDGILGADADVLKMFDFPLVEGDEDLALRDKASIVLSESAAKKYFGTTRAIDLTVAVKLGGEFREFRVTGVAADVPRSSTISFDFLLPFEVIKEVYGERFATAWGAMVTRTYVQLVDGTAATTLEDKFPAFLERRASIPPEKLAGMRLWMQPLGDVHLDPSVWNRFEPTTSPLYLYILSAIALMILVVACINFTNILTGLSLTRIKEIGVRKVIGAGRGMLIRQFLVESVFMSLIAFCGAVALAELFLPVFNNLAGSQLVPGDLFDWVTLPVGLGLLLWVALLSGGYPALILSHFEPSTILRGAQKLGGSNVITRILVTAQFSLSVLFIICLTLMSNQIDYVKSQNLGFDEEQVLVLSVTGGGGQEILQRLRSTVGSHESVVSIAGAREGLGREEDYALVLAKTEGTESLAFVFKIDENYLSTLGIELVSGREFSPEYTTDATHSILINEAFVREHKWDSPLGKEVTLGFPGLENNTGTVVGVVKDFHYLSLHSPVEPAVLHMSPVMKTAKIYVRIKPGDLSATIDLFRNTWATIAPETPFEYYFLDQDFNQQYRLDEQWGRIVSYATFFAILISAIGLFGVTTLTLNRRTKEIGIRKVLGATVSGIIVNINKEFAYLVLIANLIAWPAAYFVMDRWLQTFAYRVSLGLTPFVMAAMVSLAIAMLTISAQAFRAANANPVDSLRYE